MRGLVWFKKDLRIMDNPALFHASENCSDGIIAVYVIDLAMWRQHFTSPNQIQFILNGLHLLQKNLATLNISLVIKKVEKTSQIPALLHELADEFLIERLFFNNELEINESRRDLAVEHYFQKKNKSVYRFTDQLILSATEVRTQQDGYFKVFTPFKHEWIKVFQQKTIKIIKKPKIQKQLLRAVDSAPEKLSGLEPTANLSLWPSGEKIAQQRLKNFIENKLFVYDQERDFPFLDSTSRLSPYLAVGMISVKNCFLIALAANQQKIDTGNKGALTWLTELIWREFYRHVLLAVPRVCMNHAYKLETEKLPWCYDEFLLAAWQQGKTGFPFVDAAMRQLNTTGWMHNRLRMVTAMFLSKNLFLDWRLGERYFANQLIDFDFCSNNGGWQWSASTGTDAVPYFRIFNPIAQSQKFDASGDFIRYYCPELIEFDENSIHDPYQYQPTLAEAAGYPRPVIDYKQSRQKTIDAFKKLRMPS